MSVLLDIHNKKSLFSLHVTCTDSHVISIFSHKLLMVLSGVLLNTVEKKKLMTHGPSTCQLAPPPSLCWVESYTCVWICMWTTHLYFMDMTHKKLFLQLGLGICMTSVLHSCMDQKWFHCLMVKYLKRISACSPAWWKSMDNGFLKKVYLN